MTTWVAFLRALNVGGRRLTNDQLAAAFDDAGMHEVRTFLASGNVVFTADVEDEATLIPLLEARLEEALGFGVPAYLRSGEQVRALARLTPFDRLDGSPDGKPQIIFLSSEVSEEQHREVAALAPDGELVVPEGREVHWLPERGISNSQLDLGTLESITGPFTVRTANTIVRLAGKFLD